MLSVEALGRESVALPFFIALVSLILRTKIIDMGEAPDFEVWISLSFPYRPISKIGNLIAEWRQFQTGWFGHLGQTAKTP